MLNSLSNGIKVLEHLSENPKPHSLKELVNALGMEKCNVFRLLQTLKNSGYVEQNPKNRKYRISLKVVCFSRLRLQEMGIRKKARPYLRDLAYAANRPAYLVVPCNNEALIVDAHYPADWDDCDAGVQIGTINKPHLTATGKLCASFLSEEDLEKLISSVKFEKYTDKTIASEEMLKKELEQVRKQGYALIDGETREGLSGVAASIYNCDGVFIGSLSVVLPEGKNTPDEWKFFIDKTKAAAEAVSYSLGYAKHELV